MPLYTKDMPADAIQGETVTHLTLSWGISRGRETYGYNIARLVDDSTGKRYRCMGGGYDMQGTVFAEWLMDTHPTALQSLGQRAYYHGTTVNDSPDALYGARWMPDGSVRLDGACGFDSIRRIAEAAGLKVRPVYGRRDGIKAITVTE